MKLHRFFGNYWSIGVSSIQIRTYMRSSDFASYFEQLRIDSEICFKLLL